MIFACYMCFGKFSRSDLGMRSVHGPTVCRGSLKGVGERWT